MSGFTSRSERLAALSASQIAARAVVLVAPWSALVAVRLAGGTLSVPLVALLVVSSAVSALQPESAAGVAVVAIVAWQWVVAVDDVATPAVLVAAGGVLAAHTAAALAAVTPPAAAIPRRVAVRWVRRAAIVAGLCVASWGIARAAVAVDLSPSVAVAIAGGLAALVPLWLLWPRPPAPGGGRGRPRHSGDDASVMS